MMRHCGIGSLDERNSREHETIVSLGGGFAVTACSVLSGSYGRGGERNRIGRNKLWGSITYAVSSGSFRGLFRRDLGC